MYRMTIQKLSYGNHVVAFYIPEIGVLLGNKAKYGMGDCIRVGDSMGEDDLKRMFRDHYVDGSWCSDVPYETCEDRIYVEEVSEVEQY